MANNGWIIIIVISALIVSSFGARQSSDGITFSGKVTIDGQPAVDGTRVYATSGVHFSNIVEVQNGRYSGLALSPAEGLPAGTPIDFFIGGRLTSPTEVGRPAVVTPPCELIRSRPGTQGVRAGERAVYEPGRIEELHLTLLDASLDTDGDGLSDSEELLGLTNYLTEPLLNDTDDDGLSDGNEVHSKNTNPLIRDSECDGIEDGSDLFATTDNQVIYNSTFSFIGVLIVTTAIILQWHWGLTPGRRTRVREQRDEERRLRPLVDRLRELCATDYDGYIRLSEVMHDLGVDEVTALKCLKKLDASDDGEYYVVTSVRRNR